VDLGGTTMRAALVDPDGTLRWRSSEPTPHDARCPDALDKLMISVRDHDDCDHPEQVVLGVPGRVDYRAGRLEYAPNLPPSWVGELTEERLSEVLGVAVHLANDADLATVGESYYGAGAAYHDVVYVTVSTGIGAGVVLDGQLVRGSRSLAEVGHTIISVENLAGDAPVTAEHLGSGTALAAQARRRGLDVDGAALVRLVRAGDSAARGVWDEVMSAVAATIVNLTHLFSPTWSSSAAAWDVTERLSKTQSATYWNTVDHKDCRARSRWCKRPWVTTPASSEAPDGCGHSQHPDDR
jgi:glucokinase